MTLIYSYSNIASPSGGGHLRYTPVWKRTAHLFRFVIRDALIFTHHQFQIIKCKTFLLHAENQHKRQCYIYVNVLLLNSYGYIIFIQQ